MHTGRVHGLCAQTDQTTPLIPRELADVVGFPVIGAFTPSLIRATYRAAGYQQPVTAVAVTADQALAATTTPSWWNCKGSLLGRTMLRATQTSCCLPGIMFFPPSCPHNPERTTARVEKRNHLQNSGSLLGEGWHRQGKHIGPGFSVPDSFKSCCARRRMWW